jgi:hypothetical protein
LSTDITLDEYLATRHGLADVVKPVTCSFDAKLFRSPHPQVEYLADIDWPAGCLQGDALDL